MHYDSFDALTVATRFRLLLNVFEEVIDQEIEYSSRTADGYYRALAEIVTVYWCVASVLEDAEFGEPGSREAIAAALVRSKKVLSRAWSACRDQGRPPVARIVDCRDGLATVAAAMEFWIDPESHQHRDTTPSANPFHTAAFLSRLEAAVSELEHRVEHRQIDDEPISQIFMPALSRYYACMAIDVEKHALQIEHRKLLDSLRAGQSQSAYSSCIQLWCSKQRSLLSSWTPEAFDHAVVNELSKTDDASHSRNVSTH